MKALRKRKIDPVATLLCSTRFENGVEIIEREKHQVITINASEGVGPTLAAEPRLIIGDGITSATKLFIAKTRSEIEGLNTFLKTLTRPALDAK